MKRELRWIIEQVFRRLPVSRAAYAQLDLVTEALPRVNEQQTDDPTARSKSVADCFTALSARAQLQSQDPHRLEYSVPMTRTLDERILIATRCRDADVLPKVPNAGALVNEADGTKVQIMHNGTKVLAGGYYGDWMQDLIRRCDGHHEPQEEVMFAEVMKHVSPHATMIEVGGFWSFYSIWFKLEGKNRTSIVIEPDPANIAVGRANARLNDCGLIFIEAFVGGQSLAPLAFQTESSGLLALPCVAVPDVMATYSIAHLDVLHCDAQGIELSVLESCLEAAAAGKLSWVIVSTHAHQISGDPLTHQRCLGVLDGAGATILAEHDVHESFSGDGLIVAKFGPVPQSWTSPSLTYNRYSESLFRNPIYDLAAAMSGDPVAAG